VSDQYTFYAVTVKTLGPLNETVYELSGDLVKRTARLHGDD